MKPQIPLCNSTMCQRICMGTFVMALVGNWLFGMNLPMNLIALVTIVILGIGMLGTMSHLGKPGRVLGAMRNPTSHLTLEMLTCVPVGVCYLLMALDLAVPLGDTVMLALEVVGALASVLFIWVTARAYRMKARPAWDTFYTPLNFMLTFLSAGSLGACFACTLAGSAVPLPFLALAAVLLSASIAGQLLFTHYVAHVGYRVDVKAFGRESRNIYIAWILLGIVLPVCATAVLFAAPAAAPVAGVAFIADALSLAVWQAFFFISGKEVWYFPQYEKDISPAYY